MSYRLVVSDDDQLEIGLLSAVGGQVMETEVNIITIREGMKRWIKTTRKVFFCLPFGDDLVESLREALDVGDV